MKKSLLTTMFLWYCCASFGQTITDGLMMPKGALCTGFVYSHEEWTKYWEGTLNRKNGNIGTVSTRSLVWMGNYGILPKLNVIAMVPQIWTKATGGTMRSMEGIQDLTLAAKYELFKQEIQTGKLKGFAVLAFSTPLTNYTPDFLPLSIGMATTNVSYRLNLNHTLKNGVYVNGSTAYTWRSNTTLDRPTYYTDGKMFLTSEVRMPNVFDYLVNVGYHKRALQVDVNYAQMVTLGGGDIRRQELEKMEQQHAQYKEKLEKLDRQYQVCKQSTYQ